MHRLHTTAAGYVSAHDLRHPSVKAAVAHLQFETVHPFPDGNGRVGRVLMHCVLQRYRPGRSPNSVRRGLRKLVSSGALAETRDEDSGHRVFELPQMLQVVDHRSVSTRVRPYQSQRVVRTRPQSSFQHVVC